MSDTAVTILAYASWTIGSVAMVMLPIRARGLFVLFKAWHSLRPKDRVLTAMMTIAIVPALLIWFFVLLGVSAFVVLWFLDEKTGNPIFVPGMLMPILAIKYAIIECLSVAPRRQLKRLNLTGACKNTAASPSPSR